MPVTGDSCSLNWSLGNWETGHHSGGQGGHVGYIEAEPLDSQQPVASLDPRDRGTGASGRTQL